MTKPYPWDVYEESRNSLRNYVSKNEPFSGSSEKECEIDYAAGAVAEIVEKNMYNATYSHFKYLNARSMASKLRAVAEEYELFLISSTPFADDPSFMEPKFDTCRRMCEEARQLELFDPKKGKTDVRPRNPDICHTIEKLYSCYLRVFASEPAKPFPAGKRGGLDADGPFLRFCLAALVPLSIADETVAATVRYVVESKRRKGIAPDN